ncbi:MAG: 50S ribosomal protein L25 [Acidobacteria bacterium]|jgi:large subunit ribosomal protein L25|nr:50S ribosomal protein L25 [Acidobacteriota bacterium]
MRKDITIAAEGRATRGKNEARRLRVSGRAPAIIYGTGRDPVAVAISPKEVNKILLSSTGHNSIFDVAVDGGTPEPVMIVDWSYEPVKGNLLHIDMQRIDLTKRIKVKIPVHVHGEPKGVKQQGGVLDVVTREVEVECLPDDIPADFRLEIASLEINQAIRAADLPMTNSMKLVMAPEAVIVHIVAPKLDAEAAAAAGEPEVIKKGKKDDKAPAADAKAKKK